MRLSWQSLITHLISCEAYYLVSGRTKYFWSKIIWCLIPCRGLVYKFRKIYFAYTPISLNSSLTAPEASFWLLKYVPFWVRCSESTVIPYSLLCSPCMNFAWKTEVVLNLCALYIAELCLIPSLPLIIMILLQSSGSKRESSTIFFAG